jgi:hypothetical protein
MEVGNKYSIIDDTLFNYDNLLNNHVFDDDSTYNVVKPINITRQIPNSQLSITYDFQNYDDFKFKVDESYYEIYEIF